MNECWAALLFFTRLPLHRWRSVPAEAFKSAVHYWSLIGWLTGGVMAGVLWLTSLLFPLEIAFLLAITSRVLLTGALHEDGLADFLDGFGGGTSRERTLAIMKDSFIGSYGVIGLILYFVLLYASLSSLTVSMACGVMVAGDSFSKLVASQLINRLPYARKEEESKARLIYDRMPPAVFIRSLLIGILPLTAFMPLKLWVAALAPILVFGWLSRLMRRRLQGYTGDCCGATFLLCELSFYLAVSALYFSLSLS